MEVEMELAGSLKDQGHDSDRDLSDISGCIKFCKEDHGTILIREKVPAMISFFKENASANEITMHYLLEIKYEAKKSERSLYGKMKKMYWMKKTKFQMKLKNKKFRKKELTRKQQNTYEVWWIIWAGRKSLQCILIWEGTWKIIRAAGADSLTLSEYRLKNERI